VSAQQGGPLHCPQDDLWPAVLREVNRGADAFRQGDFSLAKAVLTEAAEAATRDERRAFACSVGVSSIYRAMAFAYCANPQLEAAAMRRAQQIGLRFLHLSMNWLTHAFVTSGHDREMIDGSAWPIGIQEINDDLTAVSSSISSTGPLGHRPTPASEGSPHDLRMPELKIGIVSLCAYPPGHPLPKYSASIQGEYAERHGYTYLLERELVDASRPPAWGKVRLMERHVRSGKYDWLVWADCDTYFMNMSITIESVLFTYAGQGPEDGGGLDPEVHMIVAEDAAMLNTGIFFVRSTPYVKELLSRVWGDEQSPWINHPWWENAVFAWQFLKDNARRLADEDPYQWRPGDDDMAGVYNQHVRLAPQSHFNSYHPITSRFLHDTWEEGKYVIAFNGVLSGSSPMVTNVLYGNYYRMACKLNEIENRCVAVDDFSP